MTAGEAADVLIIQPNFVAELIKSGKVVSAEHPIIGRVGIEWAQFKDQILLARESPAAVIIRRGPVSGVPA